MQRLRHSTSKDEDKQHQKNQVIQKAHRDYLDPVEKYLGLAEQTSEQTSPHDLSSLARLFEAVESKK